MTDIDPQRRPGLAPNAAIIFSTLLWGTLWIPLRQLHEAGLSDATATTASFALCLLILLPFGLFRWRRVMAGGSPVVLAGLFMALGFALYAEGLVRGQVARVLLLFYLAPVWSTLLGRLMLGVPITRLRVLIIILGFAGMLVIFGVEAGVPLPQSLGDWMGLASGLVWSLAMVYVNRTAERPYLDRVFVQFIFLAPLFYLLTMIPGPRDPVGLDAGVLLGAAAWLVAFALLWALPLVWLSVFGASALDPGRVAIFLLFDIVIGLGTSAWLTTETLGPRELIGAALIMAAGLGEFFSRPPRRALA